MYICMFWVLKEYLWMLCWDTVSDSVISSTGKPYFHSHLGLCLYDMKLSVINVVFASLFSPQSFPVL